MKTQKNLMMNNTTAKPNLNFSIENILREDNPAKTSFSSINDVRGATEAIHKETPLLIRSETRNLPWLAYTRYSPPKIPSKFKEL